MAIRSVFEKRILAEIQDIPPHAQEKLAKLIRFFKKELLDADQDEETKTKRLLALAGSWQDERSAEEIIKDIQSARRSRAKPVEFS